MNTIIEIQYKNYSENLIVNESNFIEVLELLFSDKSIIDFEIIQQGIFDVQNEILKSDIIFSFPIPKKVQTIFSLESKIEYIENRSFFSDSEFRAAQTRKQNFEKTLAKKLTKLNNIQKLFI